MNICFISASYPTAKQPQAGVFLQQFARTMAQIGHKCTVISPISCFKKRASGLTHSEYTENFGENCQIKVYRPTYFSMSQKRIGPFNSAIFTQKSFERCVLKTIKKLPEKPDLLYGLFLYMGGKTAAWCGKRLAIPAVVEVGEGVFWSIKPFGEERACRELSEASAFRPLGRHLQRALIEKLHIPAEKTRVFPNGVNRKEFMVLDRQECRQKLALPSDKFIIVFVGTFNNDKGGPLLLQAVEQIPDCYLVMIGAGGIDFTSERILFKGLVKHEELPAYYNAGDIFVLPTRIEGSCNAAIEAVACGLPMITSKREHMADIADETNALTVDEMSVEEIKAAIIRLRDDKSLRDKLAQGALAKAEKFDNISLAGELTAWFEKLEFPN